MMALAQADLMIRRQGPRGARDEFILAAIAPNPSAARIAGATRSGSVHRVVAGGEQRQSRCVKARAPTKTAHRPNRQRPTSAAKSVESRCDAVALGSNISVSAPFVWRCLTGSSLNSSSHFSLPRYGRRVGLHIVLFGACSAFTRVAACTLALSPIRDTLIEGFSHFVTSMTAPIASGWSGCRVGFSPTGKRRLCTAT